MSVEQNLEQILSARYGKDVRQSIHDAIYDINEVAKDAEYHASTAPTSAQAYANAALAAEQAAQQAKQDAEAAAEQAMSGTPTGYEQLVSDVYSLETEEDSVLAATPTFTGRVLLDKMYGMSIQNGTPTPSVPVAIKSAKANFKVVNKNILDYLITEYTLGGVTFSSYENNKIKINGTATSSTTSYKLLDYQKLPAGNYKLVMELSAATANMRVEFARVLKGTHTWNSNHFAYTFSSVGKNIKEFTITQEEANTYDFYVNLIMTNGATYNNVIMSPSLIFAGNANTDYQEHQAQTITTDLTLRAIEVTSSADYNLVKDGKYYVADTLEKIDGGYQITRRVDAVTLDGSESWSAKGDSSNRRFELLYTQKPYKSPRVVSDHFTYSSGVSNPWGVANAVWGNNGGFQICNNTGTGITDVATFKTWLESNNTVMFAILKTPTTESVSNANAKKLLSLKSYDEATYIAQTEDTEGECVLMYGSTELSNMAVTGYVEGEQNSIRLSDLESTV